MRNSLSGSARHLILDKTLLDDDIVRRSYMMSVGY